MSSVHARQQKPSPRPLVSVQGFAADYPVASLGPLREAVQAVQGITQAPAALAAHSALAIASLAVQAHADVETLGGPRPLSLFFLTIAASGERKSTCYALLSTALPYGLTVTEATVDGLFRSLGETPSMGLLSDEGGQFLGGYAMSGVKQKRTLAVFNDLWQGKTIRNARKDARDSVELSGRRLAVLLMVQPAMVQDLLANPRAVESGFLPRFLICEPKSTIGTRLHANAVNDEAPIAAFNARLEEVLSSNLPVPDPETGGLVPRTLPLSNDARALLIRMSDKIEGLQKPGAVLSSLTGYASKTAEQAARLAGVLTLWRDLAATEVSEADMISGLNLAVYYLKEAARATGHASLDADLVLAELLRKWLYGRPNIDFVAGDILQFGPKAVRNRRTVERLLAVLAEHGWVQKLPAGTVIDGAARTTAWRLTEC